MLQPSLSGDARISVICTVNPDPNAVTESTSTLLFAQRVKKVHVSDSWILYVPITLINVLLLALCDKERGCRYGGSD
jgi:Kinesin motor domain